MSTVSEGRPSPPAPKEQAVLDRLRSDRRQILDTRVDREWLGQITRHPDVLLHRMDKKGLLHRIQKGRYLAELSGHAANAPAISDLEPLGPALLEPLGHASYLSWHTALFHHGLLEQQSSTIYVATSVRKRDASFDGFYVRFVQVPAHRLDAGHRPTRFRQQAVQMATVERALVDGFARPRLTAPFPVTANALREAWTSDLLDPEALVDDVIDLGRHTVARRIGFFMVRWDIPGAERLQGYLGRGYAVPLAPGGRGPHRGVPVDSRWGVVADDDIIFTAEHLK